MRSWTCRGAARALSSLLLLQLLLACSAATPTAELHEHDEFMPNVAAMRFQIDESLVRGRRRAMGAQVEGVG